jgi:hypothetical protein
LVQQIGSITQPMIYPNPGSDVIYVTVNENLDREMQFALADILGRLVVVKDNLGSGLIHVPSLIPGPYFYQITHHGKIIDSGIWIRE